MNDIKAGEEQKAEGKELSERLREQRPMFEDWASTLTKDQAMRAAMQGNRFYQ